MDVQTIVADAEGYAKQVLTDAGNAADAVLTNIGQTEPAELQKIEDDVLATLLDFVPSAYRAAVSAVVTPIAQGAETKINQQVDAAVASGLAIAKARINAVTGASG